MASSYFALDPYAAPISSNSLAVIMPSFSESSSCSNNVFSGGIAN
jgi:hypothetical protein